MQMLTTQQREDVAAVRIDVAKLEKARTEAGLSRQYVADACEVTYLAIWNIENNKNLPSADLLAKLCTLYNKDVRDLLADAA